MPEPNKLIPLRGGYRKLKSFQMELLASDVALCLCDRYFEKLRRTLAALLPELLKGGLRAANDNTAP